MVAGVGVSVVASTDRVVSYHSWNESAVRVYHVEIFCCFCE